MRLLGAELMKLRRRWATYVVFGILIGLMALVFVLIGTSGAGRGGSESSLLTFPDAYQLINQFVFSFGGILATAYAAGIGGADWAWGVFGVAVARGESRSRYVLMKALAVAIVIAVGVLAAYAIGILLTFVAAALSGGNAGNPFSGSGARDATASVGLGYLVVIERAAIGFTVATVLKSQVAGIVAGIALLIGEGILSTILLVTSLGPRLAAGGGGLGGLQPTGPEWFQFLPFSIGDQVLREAPGVQSNVREALLRPVALAPAVAVTCAYLLIALAISAWRAERAEITSAA